MSNTRNPQPVRGEAAVMDGGEALVATLINHGVSCLFGLAGESYLPVIAALDKAQQLTFGEIGAAGRQMGGQKRDANTPLIADYLTHRQESEAAFAAMGYARASHLQQRTPHMQPGICFVTRGPGMSNAAGAVHLADQDSVPLVMFVGQANTHEQDAPDAPGKGANQYIDYQKMFGHMAKAVLKPQTPQEVAEKTQQALAMAVAGRPGPVMVELPLDVLQQKIPLADFRLPMPQPRAAIGLLADDPALDAALDCLNTAKKLLIIAGEMVDFEGAEAALADFAEQTGAAVATAFRRQHLVQRQAPHDAGEFGLQPPLHLQQAWQEADVVVLLGERGSYTSVGRYADADYFRGKHVVQVFPDRKTIEGVLADHDKGYDHALHRDASGAAKTRNHPLRHHIEQLLQPSRLSDAGISAGNDAVTASIQAARGRISGANAAGSYLFVHSDAAPLLAQLAARVQPEPAALKARLAWRETLHAAQVAYKSAEAPGMPEGIDPAAVNLADVVKQTAQLAPEAIITTDAGNFAAWMQRFHPFPVQHQGPANGTMGFGLPAAFGAWEANPERPVIAFVGDGGFLMNGPALLASMLQAQAVRRQAGPAMRVITLVCDNGSYGTIAMHHALSGYNHAHPTDRNASEAAVHLINPDFAAMAASYPGLFHASVSRTAEFAPALQQALRHAGPALIHLKLPRALSLPGKSTQALVAEAAAESQRQWHSLPRFRDMLQQLFSSTERL